MAVEVSITPTGTSLTLQNIEDAVLQLIHVHLPKLRDAGLVQVNDRHVELVVDPVIPIQDWLKATAAVELDTGW